MQWNEENDILLMREMAAVGIFQNKSGSRERGQIWQEIATALNNNPDFQVNLRDHFTTIMKKHKAKTRKEVSATGLGGDEPTEYEIILEDLIEMSDECDLRGEQESAEKEQNTEDEKAKALDIRKTATERFGETRKRKELEGFDDPKEKKSRRSSTDIMYF